MKNKPIKILISSIVASYFIFAFCLAEFNPFVWDVMDRVRLIFSTVFIAFIIDFLKFIDDEK